VQTGYTTANDTPDELRIGTYDGGAHKAATYLDFSALNSELSNDTIEARRCTWTRSIHSRVRLIASFVSLAAVTLYTVL